MANYAELKARYIAEYGWSENKNTRREIERKLRAFCITNETCACHYCQRPLNGGADSHFDHTNANGNEWRNRMRTRDELQKIVDGTHPEGEYRKFLCIFCNDAKGTKIESEWLASPAYRRRVIEQRHLNELAEEIEREIGE